MTFLGTVIAFSVPVPRSATVAAGMHNIPIFSSKIIYQVVEDVRQRVANLLPTEYEKRVSGEASVLQIFDLKLSGGRTKTIAGCRVTKGIVEKNKKAQVVRRGEVIHEGKGIAHMAESTRSLNYSSQVG
jgi:translation initiation factor IF-2